jgi:hypothetical protein
MMLRFLIISKAREKIDGNLPEGIIFFSEIRETSDLIEECGEGSSPFEAHCGGWEGLGKDGGELAL